MRFLSLEKVVVLGCSAVLAVFVVMFDVQFLPLRPLKGQHDTSTLPDKLKRASSANISEGDKPLLPGSELGAPDGTLLSPNRVLLTAVLFLGSFFAYRARRAGTTWAQARGAAMAAPGRAREAYMRALESVRDAANAFGVEGSAVRTNVLLALDVIAGIAAIQALWVFAIGETPYPLALVLQFFVSRLRGRGRPAGDEERRNALSDIADIMSKVPIEEYVPESDLDKCTISQLKKMLKIRRPREGGSNRTADETTSISSKDIPNERKGLVEAVIKCRQSSDLCCICHEDYQSGDPLRVLPRCHHEFHLECIDQWSQTFATPRDGRSRRDPSCPLCNAALK